MEKHMDKQSRIKYFDNLRSKKPYSHKDIYYKGKKQKLPVYEIDLDYLVYNQWNGRIASLVKSHFKETGFEIDATDPKGVELIEKFLWQSNEPANRNTEKSITDHGQNEYGIVTRDGVVIDGNRRSMILRKVAQKKKESPVFFLGVVLEESLEDNPKEIMRLETTYQMGEDAKVDYKPIEKYLKCKDMKNMGFTPNEIGKAMGETETKIKEYLSIMDLMDKYLTNLGYSGIYTRLDKTEDLFINLDKVLKRWSNSSGKIRDWKPSKSDLTDFELICFDHIRYVYNSPPNSKDAKDIRERLTRNSEDAFFAHKNIWKDFATRHETQVEPVTLNEKSIDDLRKENPTRDLSSLLKSRDEAWAKQVHPSIEENFGKTNAALENLKSQNEPLKLLIGALDKLEAIDTNAKAFLDDEKVFQVVDSIRKLADEYKKKLIHYNKHS